MSSAAITFANFSGNTILYRTLLKMHPHDQPFIWPHSDIFWFNLRILKHLNIHVLVVVLLLPNHPLPYLQLSQGLLLILHRSLMLFNVCLVRKWEKAANQNNVWPIIRCATLLNRIRESLYAMQRIQALIFMRL